MNLENSFKNASLTLCLERISNSGWFWIVKRLSGNDTGATGGHQSGLYLPKSFFQAVFPEICTTDEHNPSSFMEECYFPSHDYCARHLRAIYYNTKYFPELGKKKKYDEFRLTRWGGSQAPVQDVENTGAVCLLAVNRSQDSIRGICWLATTVEEEALIESWLGEEVEPGRFYSSQPAEKEVVDDIVQYIPENWFHVFPSGRDVFELVSRLKPRATWNKSLDELLLERREIEFRLFGIVEEHHVLPKAKAGFNSVEEFIKYALSVANRRKSRTGTSLELNLESIFATQARTEGKKKPDFLFPSREAYRNPEYPVHRLHMLGAKTCCKDRWRQILNEANRIKPKHLFTLQEGVSEGQIREMYDSDVCLVVPRPRITSFPRPYRERILDLEGFVNFIRHEQITVA